MGRLEAPRPQGKYDTGQLFLHRVFGYRGVILFPWQARVYDRDTGNKTEGVTAPVGDEPPIRCVRLAILSLFGELLQYTVNALKVLDYLFRYVRFDTFIIGVAKVLAIPKV